MRSRSRTALLLIGIALFIAFGGALVTGIRKAQKAASRSRIRGHISQTHLGVRNYFVRNSRWPFECPGDDPGYRNQSWRTRVQLDERDMAADLPPAFQRDFEWNDPRNAAATASENIWWCFRDVPRRQPNWTSVIALTSCRPSESETTTGWILVTLPDSGIGWIEPRDPTFEEFQEMIQRRDSRLGDVFGITSNKTRFRLQVSKASVSIQTGDNHITEDQVISTFQSWLAPPDPSKFLQ